jgi:hypothetical protein
MGSGKVKENCQKEFDYSENGAIVDCVKPNNNLVEKEMENYVSIKQTNNGFIIELNNYSRDKKQGTFVATSVEHLKEILELEVYPILSK